MPSLLFLPSSLKLKANSQSAPIPPVFFSVLCSVIFRVDWISRMSFVVRCSKQSTSYSSNPWAVHISLPLFSFFLFLFFCSDGFFNEWAHFSLTRAKKTGFLLFPTLSNQIPENFVPAWSIYPVNIHRRLGNSVARILNYGLWNTDTW